MSKRKVARRKTLAQRVADLEACDASDTADLIRLTEWNRERIADIKGLQARCQNAEARIAALERPRPHFLRRAWSAVCRTLWPW